MIIYEKVRQGSEEWHAMRRGRPTASQFSRIITSKTGALSKSADDYISELIAECFCPEWVDFAGNKYTDRGTELEPEARAAFEAHTGLEVHQVGFCTREDGYVGCSPDGLIMGADSHWIQGAEFKCPAPKTHVGYVREGVLPDAYVQQVHGSMAVTGLNSWHFFSFFPGLKPFHLLVKRDDYTEKLSKALDQFMIDYGKARELVIPKLRIAA